jgi:GNAT superfamily N-acetyltransferase
VSDGRRDFQGRGKEWGPPLVSDDAGRNAPRGLRAYPQRPPGAYVRFVHGADVEDVAGIEADSFVRPWDHTRLLTERSRHDTYFLLADQGGRARGYAAYRLCDEILVLVRLAVAPDRRRQGYASLLLRALEERARAHDRWGLVALVPDDLLPTHLCLRAAGWRATATLRGCEGGVDGYRFERRA